MYVRVLLGLPQKRVSSHSLPIPLGVLVRDVLGTPKAAHLIFIALNFLQEFDGKTMLLKTPHLPLGYRIWGEQIGTDHEASSLLAGIQSTGRYSRGKYHQQPSSTVNSGNCTVSGVVRHTQG